LPLGNAWGDEVAATNIWDPSTYNTVRYHHSVVLLVIVLELESSHLDTPLNPLQIATIVSFPPATTNCSHIDLVLRYIEGWSATADHDTACEVCKSKEFDRFVAQELSRESGVIAFPSVESDQLFLCKRVPSSVAGDKRTCWLKV